MNMKRGIGMMAAMAALMGGMGMDMPQHRIYDRPKKTHKLGNYKHTGEIPKGCKLETERLIFKHTYHTLAIAVDIVAATPKSKAKKINKYRGEIADYLAHLSINEIILRNEFDVIEKPIQDIEVKTEQFNENGERHF